MIIRFLFVSLLLGGAVALADAPVVKNIECVHVIPAFDLPEGVEYTQTLNIKGTRKENSEKISYSFFLFDNVGHLAEVLGHVENALILSDVECLFDEKTPMLFTCDLLRAVSSQHITKLARTLGGKLQIQESQYFNVRVISPELGAESLKHVTDEQWAWPEAGGRMNMTFGPDRCKVEYF